MGGGFGAKSFYGLLEEENPERQSGEEGGKDEENLPGAADAESVRHQDWAQTCAERPHEIEADELDAWNVRALAQKADRGHRHSEA